MYTVQLYNCTHPVIVFKIYWRFEDLRGEEHTWEGRWKLEDIRFKINAMLRVCTNTYDDVIRDQVDTGGDGALSGH